MTRHLARTLSLLVLLLGLAACGGDDVTPIDGGPGDTGAPMDARMDSPPAMCASAAECDDGAFCNGLETCSPGASGADAMGCVAGTDPCTGGACDETAEACTSCGDADVDNDAEDSIACGGNDCDDNDASRYPGATEVCDANDEDCNDTTFGARDEDDDGAIDILCCNGTTCGPDCNDTNATVGPTATEACNGVDDDCDTMVDEGVQVAVFVDADRDGHGDATMSRMSCAGVAGFSAYDDDCDDTTPARSPSLPELCDVLDNDCNAATPAVGTATAAWYRDSDGDGFGDPSVTVTACSPPAMHVLLGTDCNDADPMVHPAAAERCNGLDDNCDGFANHQVTPGDFEDDDLDGFIDSRCVGGNDCDDRIPTIHPGGTEICNGRDDDCDTMTDESGGTWSYYRDGDGDGYGTGAAVPSTDCVAPAGYGPYDGDCDDFDGSRSPSAVETCNGVDDDCDALTDEDPAASGSCARPSTFARCEAGACRVLACAAATGDCNGDASDGCEARLVADARNCGACGNACGVAAECVSSSCVSSPIAEVVFTGAYVAPPGMPSALCVRRATGGVACDYAMPAPLARALDLAGSPGMGKGGGVLCGVTEARGVACFEPGSGDATTGEVGLPFVPVPAARWDLSGITDAATVDATPGYGCALRTTGGVLCWGTNFFGRLGDGSMTDRTSPVSVRTLTGATQISTGNSNACALRSTGRVSCWGDNSDGQLGTGAVGMTSSSSPIELAGVTDAVEVRVVGYITIGRDGGRATCVRRASGAVRCFGGRTAFGAVGADLSVTDGAGIAFGAKLCVLRTGGTVACKNSADTFTDLPGISGAIGIGGDFAWSASSIWSLAQAPYNVEQCGDTIDNDSDALVDAADPDCASCAGVSCTRCASFDYIPACYQSPGGTP